jgi:hypothetical protein
MASAETVNDVLSRYTNPLSDDISIDELQHVFFVMYPSNCLRKEHFVESVNTLCDDKVCHRSDFQGVLRELIRRMELRETIFWDFELMDRDSKGHISVQDAKFLFQQTLGAADTERVWKKFEEERRKNMPVNLNIVTFEEIEIHLCSSV